MRLIAPQPRFAKVTTAWPAPADKATPLQINTLAAPACFAARSGGQNPRAAAPTLCNIKAQQLRAVISLGLRTHALDARSLFMRECLYTDKKTRTTPFINETP
jgi:hypothetical protein